MSKKGLLLLNLGTPDSPEPDDVRRYLAEFLMDRFVIDVPTVARFLMVYGLILPKRPKKSSEAYKKIWTERGSPLAFHLEDLSAQVSRLLSRENVRVLSAMRYGRPAIQEALETFERESIDELTVFPLYPQYSLAATESSVDRVKELAHKLKFKGELKFVPPFYDSAGFIRCFSRQGRLMLDEFDADHVLFSFHGLPERHIRKTDPKGTHCLVSKSVQDCCERITSANQNCYRAQCFATAHAIAAELGLKRTDFGKRYSVSFQSRLGVTSWIKPYTDLVFSDLVKNGIRRLAVMCPSFVADCLETLEEIAIRGKESFRALGGDDLRLIPSLNSSEDWAEAVCEMSKYGV
jgi:ferrochelatase